MTTIPTPADIASMKSRCELGYMLRGAEGLALITALQSTQTELKAARELLRRWDNAHGHEASMVSVDARTFLSTQGAKPHD